MADDNGEITPEEDIYSQEYRDSHRAELGLEPLAEEPAVESEPEVVPPDEPAEEGA